jgi:hypothetical protein
MTDEDRAKLCTDLRDPWARTPEELAELASVAADEIERLAEMAAGWKDLAERRGALADEQGGFIEQLKAELAAIQGESAPASVVRWWARSKRTEGAK